MPTRTAIVLAAFIGLLPSCDRGKVEAHPTAPDKYNGVVMVQLPGAHVAVPHKVSEEWAIRKAVFLYQIGEMKDGPWYLGVQTTCGPTATSPARSGGPIGSFIPPPPPPPPEPSIVTQESVPDDILADLRRCVRGDVRGAAECQVTENGLVDKATGDVRGHLIRIDDILWVTPTDAEVSGEWWTTPRTLTHERYQLRKTNGGWVVLGSTWGRFREEEPVSCDG